MSERYDSAAAEHYAAYRPPLHELILERLLHPGESFGLGLDVGCGTGRSAVALTRHCGRVVGVDSSPEMLRAAQPHPRVTYRQGTIADLGRLGETRFEVITFAGSLFYTKGETLRSALRDVCTEGTTVLVYDFDALVSEIMEAVGLRIEQGVSDYDHAVNLDDWSEFRREVRKKETIRLGITAGDAAHLLLADSHRLDALAGRFGRRNDLHAAVVERLGEEVGAAGLAADLYYARYRFGR